MKPKDLLLRCYANKEGDQWQAFCIDLCLAAQGDSLSEVKDKINIMVYEYVTEALEEDREYADQLLQRKAPLKQCATYHYYKYMHLIGALKNDLHNLFKTVMPLVPRHCEH